MTIFLGAERPVKTATWQFVSGFAGDQLTCEFQLRRRWGCRVPSQRSSSRLLGFYDALQNTSARCNYITINLLCLQQLQIFAQLSKKSTSQSSSSTSTSSSVALYLRLNRLLAQASVYLVQSIIKIINQYSVY